MKLFTIKNIRNFVLVLAGTVMFNFLAFSQSNTWRQIDTTFTKHLYWDISVPNGQSDVAYIAASTGTYRGQGQILKSNDNGETWVSVYESTENGSGCESVEFITTELGFVCTQGGDIMKTTDGGANWTITDPYPSGDQGGIRDNEFWDANNGVVATEFEGVFYTSDGGDTWTQALPNVIGTMQDMDYVNATTIVAVNGNNVFKSTDSGKSWSLAFDMASLFEGQDGAQLVTVNFKGNDGIATGVGSGAFKSSDGGDTWVQIESFPYSFGHEYGAYINDGSNYIVGGSNPNHIVNSNDGGATWNNDLLPMGGIDINVIYDITVCNNGVALAVGTPNIILTTATLLSVDAIEKIETQIYPNPSAHTLNIAMTAVKRGDYVVNIYSEGGQIAYSESFEIHGDRTIEVNVSGFSNGNYIMTIENMNGQSLNQQKIQIMR